MKILKIILPILVFISIANSFTLENALKNRAIENRFYNQINQIHLIHYNIEDYILSRMSTSLSTFNILSAIPEKRTDLTSKYDNLNKSWPEAYNTEGTKSNIEFVVDRENYLVTYSNITSDRVSDEVKNIFKYNVAHSQNTIFDDNTNTNNDTNTTTHLPTISIPLSFNTIKYLTEMNSFFSELEAGNVRIAFTEKTNSSIDALIKCSDFENKVFYESNGVDGFNKFQCTDGDSYLSFNKFNTIPFEQDINAITPIVPGARVYRGINEDTATINIYDKNLNLIRIAK